VDHANTWVDARARIGADTVIEPYVCIAGPATVGHGCRIGPFAYLSGRAVVADRASVPPFSGGAA
jgi:UDP-3-O-[3-hydroxymyristoyl] glucosamine N-acyltransferase